MSASDSSVISVEENSSQLIGDGDGDESVCFAVGDKFYTYDELKKKIDAYERFQSVQLLQFYWNTRGSEEGSKNCYH